MKFGLVINERKIKLLKYNKKDDASKDLNFNNTKLQVPSLKYLGLK
jgi:hypothetical protein